MVSLERTQLSHQIIIPAVLVALMFLALLGFTAFHLGQQAVKDQVNIRNRQVAMLVAEETTISFQTILETIRLQENELSNFDHPERQEAALLNLRRHFPRSFGNFQLLNERSELTMLLATSSEPGQVFDVTHFNPPRSIPVSEHIHRALNEQIPSVSPVTLRPITNLPYITATLPLASNQFDVTGVLLAQIDLRPLWHKMNSSPIDYGSISIIDEQGIILAHTDPQQTGQIVDPAPIEPVFDGYEGTTSYIRDGKTYLVAYSPAGDMLRWGVVVEQQNDIALASVRTIGLAATLTALISALFLGILLSSVVQRVLQPIEVLSQTAAEIATSGDLSRTLPVLDQKKKPAPFWKIGKPGPNPHTPPPPTTTSNDGGVPSEANEIDVLTHSFNRMIEGLRDAQEHLKRWNEELEHRVAERTTELQTVLEVARLSGASLQEGEVLETILGQIERLIDYDTAAIMLLNNNKTALVTAATAGIALDVRQRKRPLDHYPLNHDVLKSRVPVIVPNTHHDPRWRKTENDLRKGAGSWMGVPLIVKDQAIGVIGLFKRCPDFYTPDDSSLVSALASQVAVTLSHARLYEESVRRIEYELEMAERIQRHLFPTIVPQITGLAVATYYSPARETTGDFYEFIFERRRSTEGHTLPLNDMGNDHEHANINHHTHHARLGIFLGDVSGKSLPAALLMAMARTTLRSLAYSLPDDPANVLTKTNQSLIGDIPHGSFVACSYAIFGVVEQTGTELTWYMDLCNAAQPSPLLVRNGEVYLLEGVGEHLPLGIVPDSVYTTEHIEMKTGDLIVFYTDGIVEAQNQQRELFGFERFQRVVKHCSNPRLIPQHVIDHILNAVKRWAGGEPQSDDMALVVIRVTDGLPLVETTITIEAERER